VNNGQKKEGREGELTCHSTIAYAAWPVHGRVDIGHHLT
jgi:hypothetical protein